MKYIVYKTTNLINNYIYIGVHHTKSPYKFDYYLGNGIDIRKPDSYKKCKTAFQKAVSEFGVSNFRRETLASFDTAEAAYELEEQLVNEEFLSRPDVYNMILGGRINYSNGIECYQYDDKGNYLKTFKSYEAAASELNIDPTSVRRSILYKYKILEKYYITNVKVSVLNISDYSKGLKKKVHMYAKSGEYLKSFDSYSEAGNYINFNYNAISRSVKLGTLTRAGYYFSNIKADSYDKARSLEIRIRPVYKYDKNGHFLEAYETQEYAEKNNPHTNITKAIKLKTADSNGFMWSLEKLDNFNVPNNKNKSKKVASYDENGNIIKIWKSARECCREVGSGVQNILNGRYKKHKGIIYKYIENEKGNIL